MRGLWLYAGLLVLFAAACTGAETPPPSVRADIPSPGGAQSVNSPTRTPSPLAPTLAPVAYDTPAAPLPLACPNAPRTRLIVNERGQVLEDDPRPLNVRAGPGTGFTVVEQLDIRTVFDVIGGPRCSGEYAWFRIEANGRDGWIAEGDAAAYFVTPFLPG